MMSETAGAPATDETSSEEIFFEAGLVGMPDYRRFRLEAYEETFLAMSCLDEPALEFMAVPADLVRPAMPAALRDAGLVGENERLILLLAVHGEPPSITANLAGPIAINPDDMTARQLVLEGDEYPLRAPVTAVV